MMKYFSSEGKLLIPLLVSVFIIVCCSVYAPKLQSNAIDAITQGKFDTLNPILITMFVIYAISSLCSFVQSRSSAKLSQGIVRKMRQDLFECVVNLPIKCLDQHSHGDIMSRMTNDVENISNTISQSLSSLFSGILTLIGTVVMMVYLCPQLAVLSWITVFMTLFVTRYLTKFMKMQENRVL